MLCLKNTLMNKGDIMEFIDNIVMEFIFFFNEMAVYLIFGFLVAGILHVIFPDNFIRRHMGKGNFGSVLKSTLFGIPLPICSCGVIPVAASLKNSGASNGATISFLIATPQVGADSFMITYSLLGWVFGVFRIVASLITALVSGILVNLFSKKDDDPFFIVSAHRNDKNGVIERLRGILSYTEYTLLGSIADRLIIGIIVAGLIAVVIPEDFFGTYMTSDFLSMVMMLFIGIPMYVCASASTPIAAALVMKGMSPGAALIFLLTGPATNIITISAVHKLIGKKATIVYLSVIALGSLALGYLLNIMIHIWGFSSVIKLEGMDMLPPWLKLSGSVVLITMLLWYYVKIKIIDRNMVNNMKTKKIILNVGGMSCNHCSGTVKKELEAIENIYDVNVDLKGKKAYFSSKDENAVEKAINAIRNAGFQAEAI